MPATFTISSSIKLILFMEFDLDQTNNFLYKKKFSNQK